MLIKSRSLMTQSDQSAIQRSAKTGQDKSKQCTPRLACRRVARSAGARNFERRRPSLRLRRDSLRSRFTTQAKTGGKGIRTPGLLIANETLYQLSYTPVLPMKIDSAKIPHFFTLSTVFIHYT